MADASSFDVTAEIIAFENGELDEGEIIELFQHLIDSGLVWQLQGSYGRLAIQLIEGSVCGDSFRDGLKALFEAIRLEAAYHIFFSGSWSEKTKSWRYYPRDAFPVWYATHTVEATWEPE